MPQQMSFLDMSFGKMSPELSVPTKERTSEKSSKKSSASKTVLPMFLDLRHGGYASGNLVGQSWETDTLSLGAPSMRNFGECPRDVEEFTLSQILEEKVPQKYYLSATACRGILRKAVSRGKEFPTLIKTALCVQGKLTNEEIINMQIFKKEETMHVFLGNKLLCYAISTKQQSLCVSNDLANTLGAEDYKEPMAVCYLTKNKQIILRRFTPTEYARLQGMPEWWCKDVPHTDTPEYKMWGNGMALPNILYVIEGISQKLKENL